MQSIFMVGEQRSGSNLLRLILNESASVAAPHPPHILQRFMPLLPLYGDLNDKESFIKLIDDVCRLVELNPVPWDGVTLNRDTILMNCTDKSLVAVYGAIMDCYADAHDANGWLCKSMQNIHWADELNRYFKKPKYIYLYRDPRDVALSFTKAVIGEKQPYFIAKQWNELQQLCLAQMERCGSGLVFPLSYESLLKNPQEIVKDLCEFLSVGFNSKMLDYHTSKEAERSARSSALWENVDQPINANNTRKFVNELTTRDIKIIESVTGDIMDTLGYERVLIKKGEELKFSNSDIKQFEQQNTKAKMYIKSQHDQCDVERRMLQTRLLEELSQMTVT